MVRTQHSSSTATISARAMGSLLLLLLPLILTTPLARAADLIVNQGETLEMAGDYVFDNVSIEGEIVLTGNTNIVVNRNLTVKNTIKSYLRYGSPLTRPLAGVDGDVGESGGRGKDGSDAFNLAITIHGDAYWDGSVWLTGGSGGKGGNGGRGADGKSPICGGPSDPAGIPGSPGGNGAPGGSGGNGGNGGHFRFVCHGTLTVPDGSGKAFSVHVDGGQGGNGGRGGLGGRGYGGCNRKSGKDPVTGLNKFKPASYGFEFRGVTYVHKSEYDAVVNAYRLNTEKYGRFMPRLEYQKLYPVKEALPYYAGHEGYMGPVTPGKELAPMPEKVTSLAPVDKPNPSFQAVAPGITGMPSGPTYHTVDRFTFAQRQLGIQLENALIRRLGSSGVRVAMAGGVVTVWVAGTIYAAYEGWNFGRWMGTWVVWDSVTGSWMTFDQWVEDRLNEILNGDPEPLTYEYYQAIESRTLREYSDEMQRVWDMTTGG